VAAVGKELGRRWQCLDPAVKKDYEARAVAAKEQYIQALAAYTSSPEFVEKQRQLQQERKMADMNRKGGMVKEPVAPPKRPPSAFQLWAAANRQLIRSDMTANSGGNNSLPGLELQKEMARRWNTLDTESKA
jgi:hypothetical protein